MIKISIVPHRALRAVALVAVIAAICLPVTTARADRLKPMESAVLAGGCFWGMEEVFEQLLGVNSVVAGYAGGTKETARYDLVGSGATGHAESVRIVFDPRRISYQTLLRVFFNVAHDPTELNRQGPDDGTQYRSAIFFANDEQRKEALTFMSRLATTHAFSAPIVTQVVPLHGFYPAEPYHQHYARLHPDNPYIVQNDAPKVALLRSRYPALTTH